MQSQPFNVSQRSLNTTRARRGIKPSSHMQRSTRAESTMSAASWQSRAIAAYQQAEPNDVATMQHELAARISALTEHEIVRESVYVNRDAHLAVAAIEGVVFRLRRADMMIVRPCVECGVGQYESPFIATVQDLGHALVAWELRCPHCEPQDPINWLDE